MNILNQPINPGGHPVFPAAKETVQPTPASVRFDGHQPMPAASVSSHAQSSPRWQAQTLRRASSHVGVEQQRVTTTASEPPCKLTLDFLRSLLDRAGGGVAEAEDGPAPPGPASPPPLVPALRVVVTSAVELDARQTELIARKMRRITGFANIKLENVVDPSLIAGFVICYGTGDSHVIDLSVKGKLDAIKNRVDSSDHDHTAHAHGNPHHC
ncbi:hypothetical protein PR202_gb11045 [Eleusine coracana subsp. coracana]|uniref:Uncharacterized protein n=1 Tax=Eleusine coracana subsp. coracana TaxID=191504 RepID=A0AAV5EJ72_ELECO|nr:hypothetical protein QOZ80_3AG0217170 [Eleusine coracana subsp. coracana]GJN23398.1 hypothetical protein PR202_gb11045 [Eleusine coracana subsp. coracana]